MVPVPTLFLVVVPLIAWRVYRRAQRFMARQRSKRWRHWSAVICFPLLIALIALANRHAVWTDAALAFGVAAGVAVGVVGLRLTRFEVTPEGCFFTPNGHIGVALSSLLVLRLLYRYGQAYAATGTLSTAGSGGLARSPLTLLVFGLLAGYYVAYGIGLLRWRARAQPAPVAAAQEAGGTGSAAAESDGLRPGP